jgi:hypothetical protein
MPLKTETKKIKKSILSHEGWELTNDLIKKAQDDYAQKWFNPKISEELLNQIANELQKQGYKDADIEDLKEIYDTASRVAIYTYPDKGSIKSLTKDAQPFKINSYNFIIKKDSAVLGMYGYLIAKGNNTKEAEKLAKQYADDHKKSRLTISAFKV